MKVGILSMQRVNNYGSFWQAYCLKKLIEDNENIVEFIDIIPGQENTRTEYKYTFKFSKIKRIPYYLFQREKKLLFHAWQNEKLNCFDERNYSVDYDSIVIGSDEVFNFVQDSPWGFTTQLYGNMDNDNVNTYAASFGFTTIKDIENSGFRKDISSALFNLQNISVRDRNSAEIVKDLIGIDPEMHLDPVVIGDLPIENLTPTYTDSYILVYSYDFRFSDSNIIKHIKEIARKEKCKIYSVGFWQNWCDKNIIADPMQLLSYFRYAKYVITDTFHGVIFSMRCHKKFIVVIRETNRQKLNDLLVRLKVEDRIVTNNEDIFSVLNQEIDYNLFERIRRKEETRTKNYIKLCVKVNKGE